MWKIVRDNRETTVGVRVVRNRKSRVPETWVECECHSSFPGGRDKGVSFPPVRRVVHDDTRRVLDIVTRQIDHYSDVRSVGADATVWYIECGQVVTAVDVDSAQLRPRARIDADQSVGRLAAGPRNIAHVVE